MFALISESEGKPWISLKCDPLLAQILRQKYEAVVPGYHLNKTHWNTVLIDGTIPDDEVREMIDHSYELVFKSLKKSERESLTE
jgi:predicted DNA-binding protein (MmcQ/YjbR family)